MLFPFFSHFLFFVLHAHATGGAQCRYNRRCDACYHLHDEL